jgi:hypothetical protein
MTFLFAELFCYFILPAAASSRAKASFGGAGVSAMRVAPSSAGQKSPLGNTRRAGAFYAACAGNGRSASCVTHTSPVGVSAPVTGWATAKGAVATHAAAIAASVRA